MTKKKTLLNERVIRRWGKLANMPALTETFLDSFEEEGQTETLDEEEMEMEMEMDAEAGESADAEASPEEAEAVEKIVAAVVDAISNETGVEIEVEGDAEDMSEPEADAGEDMEMGDEEDPAMMDPALRDHVEHDEEDDIEEAMRGDKKKKKMAPAKKDDEDEKMKKEELDLEVIDDEELTEAVLKRVVERLLRRQ